MMGDHKVICRLKRKLNSNLQCAKCTTLACLQSIYKINMTVNNEIYLEVLKIKRQVFVK